MDRALALVSHEYWWHHSYRYYLRIRTARRSICSRSSTIKGGEAAHRMLRLTIYRVVMWIVAILLSRVHYFTLLHHRGSRIFNSGQHLPLVSFVELSRSRLPDERVANKQCRFCETMFAKSIKTAENFTISNSLSAAVVVSP